MLLTGIIPKRTVYGGSLPFSKLEADERILTLFAGYPFSKEYNEERGHEMPCWMLNHHKRVTDKNRRRPVIRANLQTILPFGMKWVWTHMMLAFQSLGKNIEHSIGCAIVMKPAQCD
jgi:nitrite reductase (cytochrome c-552)